MLLNHPLCFQYFRSAFNPAVFRHLHSTPIPWSVFIYIKSMKNPTSVSFENAFMKNEEYDPFTSCNEKRSVAPLPLASSSLPPPAPPQDTFGPAWEAPTHHVAPSFNVLHHFHWLGKKKNLCWVTSTWSRYITWRHIHITRPVLTLPIIIQFCFQKMI